MLAELEAAAADAGAYGVSKERYLRGGEAAAPLPPGAAWRTVSVRYARYDPGLPYGSERGLRIAAARRCMAHSAMRGVAQVCLRGFKIRVLPQC